MRRALLAALAVLVASLTLAPAGCGGGGAATDLDAFAGAWQATGTSTNKCNGKADPLTTTITITKGTSAPLLVVQNACPLSADASGKTATLRGGQQCAQTIGNTQLTTTITGGTFTIDGLAATYTENATVSLPLGKGGAMIDCMLIINGTAMKIGK